MSCRWFYLVWDGGEPFRHTMDSGLRRKDGGGGLRLLPWRTLSLSRKRKSGTFKTPS